MLRLAVTGIAVLVTACGSGGQAAAPPRDDVVRLWDGGSLAGWSHAGSGAVDVVDTAQGPVLETRGGLGLLWYDRRSFSDYVLRLQWRALAAEDNSGVFVGFPDPGDDPWTAVEQGYEVQIYDGVGGDPQKTGSIYGEVPPDAAVARSPGQWNDLEIRVEAEVLTVALNGTEVTTFSPRGGPDSLHGHIGLQNHGASDRVQFRAIELTELGPLSRRS